MKKREKGVTLIALVVTIIVLIIVAGISITAITGQKRNCRGSQRGKYYGRKRKYNRKNRSRYLYRKS